MKPLILIVEDESALVTMLRYNLERDGYRIVEARDGEEALMVVREERPDLVLLDWMLPLMSGLEVCRQLRRRTETRDVPIIILTARGEELDKVRGLDAGADDYITKPFSQRLLVERIRSLLRRERAAKDEAGESAEQPLVRGDLMLDPGRHLCTWCNRPVNLTVTEFLILKALAMRPGHVKNRDQLMDAAYGEHIYVGDRTVDSHIKRLRKKFKAIDDSFSHIETLYGVGYRYRDA